MSTSVTRMVILRLSEREFKSLKLLVDEGINAMEDDPVFARAVGEDTAMSLKSRLNYEVKPRRTVGR